MLCTCPLDELDFDVFLTANVKNRCAMGFVCFAVALANVTIIPTALSVLPGILIMCGGKQVHERRKPRSTTLLQMFFAGDLISCGIKAYRRGHVSIEPEYAQCERDANFFYGIAYFVTILPYALTLVRSRCLQQNHTVALYDGNISRAAVELFVVPFPCNDLHLPLLSQQHLRGFCAYLPPA